MPLGFERLNERTQRPNACINFIKPLATATPTDQAVAKDFLERIAAQCYPVMKHEYISVMSLEEYPPNREFLGRNFNAGEVIQLVLKDRSGRWLSFKFVQMVMMHELAHCKQMNHSKYFWQVRNRYADQMKELWEKKYSGEGMWGRGQALTNGQFVHDRMPHTADIPEHLCGGTYRRARGKKRKRGRQNAETSTLSYAERQQRRIAKKFGIHGEGQGLGEDEMVRGAIETYKGGKRQYGKPRVASSKRGRELRANAALARLEAAKDQEDDGNIKHEALSDSETDWSGDDDSYGSNMTFDGKKIKDEQGNDMFRICGDEQEQGDAFQDEMNDLRLMTDHTKRPLPETSGLKQIGHFARDESETDVGSEHEDLNPAQCNRMPENFSQPAGLTTQGTAARSSEDAKAPTIGNSHSEDIPEFPQAMSCPICSLENEHGSPTCIACAHVLKPALVPNNWSCQSEPCKGNKYINAGDAGLCGLCGTHRPVAAGVKVQSNTPRPIGVITSDVLRWD